jgi:PIN domain nuclease of toxin-antitoxin system
MSNLLLDTHVLIWLLQDDPRMTEHVFAAIQTAADEDRVFVSAITPWEIGLLVAKKKIDLGMEIQTWLDRALSLQGLRLAPLSPKVAVDSTRLPFEIHPDPADRILVATARHLGATLVTADRLLLQYGERGYFSYLAAS